MSNSQTTLKSRNPVCHRLQSEHYLEKSPLVISNDSQKATIQYSCHPRQTHHILVMTNTPQVLACAAATSTSMPAA